MKLRSAMPMGGSWSCPKPRSIGGPWNGWVSTVAADLSIRRLILKRGTLLRAPRLNPGDPDAPILPDYDIRIDRLAVENLTVEKSVFGQRRRVDFAAKADIAGGRALIDLGGQLGGRDRLKLHLDSEPDRDKFTLDLRYNAPRTGCSPR